ncbi:hypothetical protein SAMN03003324_00121 [Pedobacter antarcticus]|nr:hypothetical protein SAMN03003324_00121 [Pedobacter antarcticus]
MMLDFMIEKLDGLADIIEFKLSNLKYTIAVGKSIEKLFQQKSIPISPKPRNIKHILKTPTTEPEQKRYTASRFIIIFIFILFKFIKMLLKIVDSK